MSKPGRQRSDSDSSLSSMDISVVDLSLAESPSMDSSSTEPPWTKVEKSRPSKEHKSVTSLPPTPKSGQGSSSDPNRPLRDMHLRDTPLRETSLGELSLDYTSLPYAPLRDMSLDYTSLPYAPLRDMSLVEFKKQEPSTKYKPINESKNLWLFPFIPNAVVGDMFNIMNGEILGNNRFSQAVIEKRSSNEEVSVKVSMDCTSFASRFDLLRIVGVQKILALTIKQPGIIDFLMYPPSKEFRYCAAVLKCARKVTKLDTNNEMLRDCLANIDVGPWTHLLSSIIHGAMFIFLLVFPDKMFDNYGQYKMERAIEKFFNAENEDRTPFRYATKIFVFSNTSLSVQADLHLDQLKELVQKIHNHPNQLMNGNEKLEWIMTSLDQFQPGLKTQLPIKMPDGSINESVEVLMDIENRLETYESMAAQVSKYDYIFSEEEYEKWVRIYVSENETLTSIKKEMVESIWERRQNQIGDRVFSAKLMEFRQRAHELPDADFEHIYLMEEKIKEVKEWKKSGLQFVGRDFDMFCLEITSPIAYVFVFKDRSGIRFGQNLRHMKTLPGNTSRLLMDSKLMPLHGFSGDFTGILKFEYGVVVEQDVLRAFEFRRRSSVARCPTSELRTDLKMSDKYSNLEIPCPSCDDEDCFWSCDRCLRPLQYDWEGYLCCECGLAPPHSFEFWCKNYRKHGDRYSKFELNELNDLLKNLRTFKDKVILILGQTGVGKSTWINSIAHYLTYGTLDDALDGEPMHLVPSSFTMVDEKLEEVRILVGEESSTESFNVGESATREPKIHSFDYKGGQLLLIDTPGVGDTRGFEQDKKNFAKVLDYISGFKELHGICILMKPNEARMTPPLRYCISQLFSQLHRNAANNIVFCLTNTQGTLYKPGETFTALKTFLAELHQNRGVHVGLTNETLYCMDNCAFRFLCAKRQGVQFDDNVHANYVEAWNKSWAETYRLIKHFTDIKPHSAAETATLNETRRIILSLAKPLALITKEIQLNVSCTEQQKVSVQSLTGDEQNFRDKLKIKRYFVKADSLPYPRTVCVSKGCVEVKKDRDGNNQQVFNKHCHEHCYLQGVTVQTYPNEALMNCAAMGGSRTTCTICGCSWNTHMHVTWYHTEESEEVEDETVKRDLQSVTDKKKAKLDTIRKCEQIINDYKQEQKQINNTAARFAAFLEKNAIILYNDSIKEYIHIEINNAKAEAAITNDFSKVEGLQRALDEYLEEKRVIQEHVNQSRTNASAADLAFELDDIRGQFDALYNLPLTGANIKTMLDLELNGQEKQLEYQRGHFNTHDRRTKANNRHSARPATPMNFNSMMTAGDNENVGRTGRKNKEQTQEPRQSSSGWRSYIPALSSLTNLYRGNKKGY